MLINQLDQRLDAVIGERQDLFIALSITPDHAVLGVQAYGELV